MRGAALGAAVIFVVVLAGRRAAAESGDLRRLFPRAAPIEAAAGSEGSLARIELPSAVLRQCRPDLSDLRILDARGVQVPFVLDRGPERHAPATRLRRVPAELLGAERHEAPRAQAASLLTESYELRAPPAPPAGSSWRLVLESGSPHFVRQLVVSSLGPRGVATELVKGSVFRLEGGSGQRLWAELPDALGERLLVRLSGEDKAALEPRFMFEAVERLPLENIAEIPLELAEAPGELAAMLGGRQRVELSRPAGIVPSALRVATSTVAFDRRVEVEDRGQGSGSGLLGAGNVFRLPGLIPLEQLEIPLAVARGQRLVVTLYNGDSPALEALLFRAVIRTPSLVFALPARADGALPATLFFGGGRAHAPRYDLDALLRDHAAEAVVAALGDVVDNPAFDRTPALDFALHPGALVDERLYTHQRQLDIVPSVDGLARLTLEAADLALLRDDYADLRIIDGAGRQWPYLLEARGRSQAVPLTIGERTQRGKTSRQVLELPFLPLAADALLLEPSHAYFNRPYRVTAELLDGKPVELAQGLLQRSAPESRTPLELPLRSARVSALALEVDNGDNEPLSFRSARASVLVPSLYLLARPGAYRMLLGNPAEAAPSYDIVRARELVLSVASRDNQPGPLAPNPGYRASARLASGDGPSNVVFWAVLVLALVVLGGFTLRLARQGGRPTP